MRVTVQLTGPATVSRVEAAVSRHLHRTWRTGSVTELRDRSSHPTVLFGERTDRPPGLSVFAKLVASATEAADEQAGMQLLATRSGVRVPVPVGDGWLPLPRGRAVLLAEGLVEHEPAARTSADWEDIGRTLARVHLVSGEAYGLDRDGWFGPLRQDNRPVPGGSWAEFYADRRLVPWLATARATRHLPPELAVRVERLVERLPELVGPVPTPRLLHGDAQHHNFVSTATGAVVIDASPYYGHPELDLALLDYFSPVPPATYAAYAEVLPLADDRAERRELWRVAAYLAVLTVSGGTPWGRQFVDRLSGAVARYA